MGVRAQAALIAVPRTAARSTASSAGNHPGQRCGGEFADGVAGDHGPGGIGERLRGQQRSRDDQRLGDCGVLDLVGAGGGTQPYQIEVGPVGHRRRGLRDAVQFEPTAEHSGFLSSLSGSDDGQHSIRQNTIGSRPVVPDGTKS